MRIPFDWIKEKTQAGISIVSNSISTLIAIPKMIYQHSGYFLNEETFSQFWHGFTRPLDLEIIPKFFNSKKTKLVMGISFLQNIIMYGGSALAYEMSKYYWRLYFPNLQDSYPEKTADCIAAYYFMCYSFHMMIDNALYNPCLSKVAPEEHPNSEHFPNCTKCGRIAKIRANIASPFYFSSNLLMIKLLSTALPFGRYVTLPLQAQVYGQCLVEYNLGEMCTTHRYDLLTKNNPFVFGLGTAFLIFPKITSMIIYAMLGAYKNNSVFLFFPKITSMNMYAMLGMNTNDVNNNDASLISAPYVYEALVAMFFQYFMYVSFLINKPLPGKKVGIDLFYPVRLVTNGMMKSASKSVIDLLQNSNKDVDFISLIKKFWESRVGELLKRIFLFKHYRSLESFMQQSPGMRLYLDLRGNEIQEQLEWIIKYRRKPSSIEAVYYISFLPDYLFPKKIQKILTFVVDKRLNGVFEDINDLITEARTRTLVIDQAALNAMRIEKNQAVNSDKFIAAAVNSHRATQQSLALPAPSKPTNIRSLLIEDYEPSHKQDEDILQNWIHLDNSQDHRFFSRNRTYDVKKTDELKRFMVKK